MSLFSSLKKAIGKLVSHGDPVVPPGPNPMELLLNRCIDEIMIPRSDIMAVNHNTPFDAVVKKFLKTGFRWIPVFRDTLDTITGLVSIHCVLSLRESENVENRWYRHLNHPLFAPPSMTIGEAMKHIQHHHKNPILFVVDEYGGIEGMVTKGAILKELFSLSSHELADDDDEMIIAKEPLLIISGRMDLETFEEEVGIKNIFNKEDEDRSNTIGGWICSYIERVPLTGEIISHPSGFTFEIRQAMPRKIHQIAILRFPNNDTESQA